MGLLTHQQPLALYINAYPSTPRYPSSMRSSRPGKATMIAALDRLVLVPPHQAYQGKELIKSVCPQDLSEAICGHLF